MKFLAFSDLHGDLRRAEVLLQTEADLYVAVGDIVNASRDDLIAFFRVVGRRPFFMIPGNNELPEWIPNYFNLHGERKTFMGITFGGLGGSPTTPFGTIFEWEEDYAYEVLEKLGYVDVLVSHTPPRGTQLAFTRTGTDAGSEAVLWYIEEYVPRVAVVGHIHEREGLTERIGGTIVFNPGRRGAIVDISPSGEPRILWL